MQNDEIQAVHGKLVEVLASTSSMYVATSSDDVWNSGAYFAELDPFTLTLVLETRGVTLRNLMANPTAGLLIAPNGPFHTFLQGRARATVRDGAGKDEIMAALLRKDPQSEPLITSAPVEAIELKLDMWRVTDVSAGWLPGKELTPQLVS